MPRQHGSYAVTLSLPRMKQQFAETSSLRKLKDIHDRSSALVSYAHASGESRCLVNDLATFKLHVERKLGSLLRDAKLRGGSRSSGSPSITLASLGNFGGRIRTCK